MAKKIKTKISQKISIMATIETNIPSVCSDYIRPKQKGKSFSLYLKKYENESPSILTKKLMKRFITASVYLRK